MSATLTQLPIPSLTRHPYVPYEEWINSTEFKRLANRCKERDGWRCRNCGCEQGLQAHHLSYRYLGESGELELADLTTLCAHHHRLVHEDASAPEPPRGQPSPDDEWLWEHREELLRETGLEALPLAA